MPGKVKVKIVAGRNLPVMDRSSDTTDAYVEIKLGNTTFKTDVCRKSLNPQWNSEWYRFEVDDAELQDEPLQIRLMDHDTYSANDAIGKVYLDLNPLLLPTAGSSSKVALSETGPPPSSHLSAGNTVSGWFPVYDTMHGIRGEVNVIVKVELFSDFNKFRQSSCGVQFFNSSTIPQGYHAQIVHGMVEELVVSDDPEYQWIDKIRTPRASNEARQTLFFKLSGEVQRRIGLKVLDLGGNAVIGYLQCFDLEAECGIVVRGLGTAVTLVRLQEPTTSYQYMEEISNNHSLDICQKPVLSVIPASPLRQSPSLELIHTKGLLAPDNPRIRRSKSPQPPFVGYKPKRLKHHKHKFIDNVPEYDNISLKVLFEQEDMRGEPISNRKKIFERLSSFPKRKLRALRSTSGLVLSKKVPYFRSKSEGVTSSLIRSIMDTTAFSLDLVPEAEEHSDARSDTDSVIHPLKYDDGHLVPISSSSSDSSSSDLDDISDISSSVSTSTQEYSRIDSSKDKHLHMLTSNNKSTSFDNSITSSKMEDELSDKDDFEFPKKGNEFISSVHIMLSPDDEFGNHHCNQFSSLVEFSEESSQPRNALQSPTGSLVRQLSFDKTFNHQKYDLQKRSDTPPLSEMDPYIDFSRRQIKYSEETVFSTTAPITVLVTQPSLDEEFRSRPLTNLSFPSNVCFLPNASNDEFGSSHPVDLNKKNNLCRPVENPLHVECSLDKIKEAEKIFEIKETCQPSTEPTRVSSISELAETAGTSDTVDKILNNPFKFPLLGPENEIQIVDTFHFECNVLQNTDQQEDCVSDDTTKEKNAEATETTSVELIVKEIVERKFLGTKQGITRGEAQEQFKDTRQNNSSDSNSCSEDSNNSNIIIVPDEDENQIEAIGQSNTFVLGNELQLACSGLTFGKIEPPLNTELKVDETLESAEDIVLFDEKSSFPFEVNERTVLEKNINCNEYGRNEDKSECNIAGTAFAADVDCGLSVFASTSTNLVCDTNLPVPTPLMKSHSASGLCQASLPSSRTVPEETSVAGLQSINAKVSQSPIKANNTPAIHRRSSDSDLSITPKGNSLTSSGDRSSVVGGSGGKIFQPICSKLSMKREPLEAMEFPFLTMSKFPPGFIINIAGTVTSRSVKLLERVSNLEEPESRDTWWTELRMEVRSHMRAMSCNAVVGYSETTTICDDVCVLSACGTAAIVNVRPSVSQPVSDTPEPPSVPPVVKKDANMNNSQETQELERHNSISQSTPVKPEVKIRHHSDSMDQPDVNINTSCSICHLPFNPATVPLSMTAIKCSICRKRKVPDLLLATIEPPEGLPVVGRSCLIHVFVTRPKAHARGEMNACVVSDSLPFIEYDIYKQLVNKLKVNGMNSVFGLKTQICLGERMIAAVTSGTAMFLEALPIPSIPTITPGEACTQDAKLATVLRGLQETIKKNRDFYQVKTTVSNGQDADNNPNLVGSDSEESEDDLPDMDIHAGNKDACIFMVDDEQDMEAVSQLIDPHPPEGFLVTATEALLGLEELEVVRNLQMFTQIWRSRIPSSQPTSSIHKNFHKLLQGIYYKLRRMTPCAVGNIQFRLALPEPDELQISIVGMAVGLGESIKNFKSVRRRTVGASSKPESIKKKLEEGDMIFSLEEDQEFNNAQMLRNARPKSPVRPTRQSTHLPPKERYGVDMTPLSYVPGGRIEKYLGNLNFFFIRETSCIREGGGMSGFVHSFVAEVLAIVRAHVTALGGNALVAFFLNECVILNNPHKNHGQCLINVGGDVVSVSYLN